jgi:hypothetical protein
MMAGTVTDTTTAPKRDLERYPSIRSLDILEGVVEIEIGGGSSGSFSVGGGPGTTMPQSQSQPQSQVPHYEISVMHVLYPVELS